MTYYFYFLPDFSLFSVFVSFFGGSTGSYFYFLTFFAGFDYIRVYLTGVLVLLGGSSSAFLVSYAFEALLEDLLDIKCLYLWLLTKS